MSIELRMYDTCVLVGASKSLESMEKKQTASSELPPDRSPSTSFSAKFEPLACSPFLYRH
ncbi:hypothetical protein YC2023_016229 [Brassica napus]